MKRIVALISGRGSNLEAILAEQRSRPIPGRVVAIVSNQPEARGLRLGERHGIATAVVAHRAYPTRESFDVDLAREVDRHRPDLVVLAGFMRILGAAFVERYAGRLTNIHPSLLPAYPGLATHRRALADGAAIHGCTVHFVTPSLDHGPIIVQGAVPVHAEDDEASLAARVLRVEHVIYPRAVRWFCEDRLSLVDGRARLAGERPGERLVVGAD